MEPVREVVIKHYLDIADIPHTTSAGAYKASMHKMLSECVKNLPDYFMLPATFANSIATHVLNNFTVSLPRK